MASPQVDGPPPSPSAAADSSLDDALLRSADDASEDSSSNFEDCSSGDGARTGAASPESSTSSTTPASPEAECVNPLVRAEGAGRASAGENGDADGDDVFDSAAEGEAPGTPASPAGEARGRRGSSLGRAPPIRRGSKPSLPASPLAPAPPPPPAPPAGPAADDEAAEEDDGIVEFLDKSNDKAEARLAARRQARAEAREIRMRELERQQKELEENADKVYDMYPEQVSRPSRVAATMATPRLSREGTNSYQSSRRSSEDSLEEGISLRDMRQELKEYEEKFRKAMVQNAQLDNEKASLTYQVELLKDRLDDLEEQHTQLQREHKEKCREHDQLKRAWDKLKEDMEWCKSQLEERDQLIQVMSQPSVQLQPSGVELAQ